MCLKECIQIDFFKFDNLLLNIFVLSIESMRYLIYRVATHNLYMGYLVERCCFQSSSFVSSAVNCKLCACV